MRAPGIGLVVNAIILPGQFLLRNFIIRSVPVGTAIINVAAVKLRTSIYVHTDSKQYDAPNQEAKYTIVA